MRDLNQGTTHGGDKLNTLATAPRAQIQSRRVFRSIELGVGKNYGTVAFALVMLIEQYPGAPIPDSHLCEVVGISQRALDKERGRLIEDGIITCQTTENGIKYAVGSNPVKRAESTRPTRTPQPTDPLFDAICELVGDGVRHSAGGRVAKLANQMHKAGVTADLFRHEFPALVRKHAAWRGVFDLNAVTSHWHWLLEPPQEIGKPKHTSDSVLMEAIEANGGELPW